MAHPKHKEVRKRYLGACGYCGVEETDMGGEMTIDHFFPSSHGGGDDNDNLVYACWRCNINKTDFFPTLEDLEKGIILYTPY